MNRLDEVFDPVLGWSVNKKPIGIMDPMGITPIEGYCAMTRNDTNQVLGIVGAGYESVSNAEIKEFIAPAIGAGLLIPAYARAYRDGRMCTLTCNTPHEPKDAKKGDLIRAQLRISWGHDGGSAIVVRPRFLRIVCTNGLTSVHEGRAFRLTHGSTVHDRLKRIERILAQVAIDFDRSLKLYARMAETQITDQGFEAYIKRSYNLHEAQELGAELAARATAPDMEDVMSDLLAGHRDQVDGAERREVVEEMLRLPRHYQTLERIYQGEGPGAHEARGTVWGAYNAVTYYVDHVGGRGPETRAYSADFGAGNALRQRAFQEAVNLVNN